MGSWEEELYKKYDSEENLISELTANDDDTIKKMEKVLNEKKLGILIAQNKKKQTTGIITDGQIRRFNEKKIDINLMPVRKIMTKNPISII